MYRYFHIYIYISLILLVILISAMKNHTSSLQSYLGLHTLCSSLEQIFKEISFEIWYAYDEYEYALFFRYSNTLHVVVCLLILNLENGKNNFFLASDGSRYLLR